MKFVIPIAGFASRMYPTSKTIPKALFPIIDPKDGSCKPILQIIMEYALDAVEDKEQVQFGIIISAWQQPMLEDFFFTANEALNDLYAKNAKVRQARDEVLSLGKRITFIIQEKQQGFGDAILQAKKQHFIQQGEQFVILLGDHLYYHSPHGTNCIKQTLDNFYASKKNEVAICLCDASHVHLYGIVQCATALENHSYVISKIVEKPSIEVARQELQVKEKETNTTEDEILQQYGPQGDYCKMFGIYCLQYSIFDKLEYNLQHGNLFKGELDMTSSLQMLANEQALHGTMIVNGMTLDTGIPEEYSETTHVLYQLWMQQKALQKK